MSQAFLKSNNVEYNAGLSSEKPNLSEIKKTTEKFTVMVKCLAVEEKGNFSKGRKKLIYHDDSEGAVVRRGPAVTRFGPFYQS